MELIMYELNTHKESPVQQPHAASDSDSSELTSQAEQTIAKLNEYMQEVNHSLQFSLDQSSGDMMILVKDQNNQIIRAISSEAAIDMSKILETDPLSLFNSYI